ncbi:hypothetical protein AAG570_002914 [Ranatra chinensis]|uniref:Uncharacterized protein n=1 Tax=Ranatra chinensis TaxID=642074 RepID=A0ABD0Y7F6_9HEMI
MTSKRRNMFCEIKKQETTDIETCVGEPLSEPVLLVLTVLGLLVASFPLVVVHVGTGPVLPGRPPPSASSHSRLSSRGRRPDDTGRDHKATGVPARSRHRLVLSVPRLHPTPASPRRSQLHPCAVTSLRHSINGEGPPR